MSAAFVSGAVALLRSEYPGLSPGAIAELLRATAWRQLVSIPPGVYGADPRWYSPIGFGAIDLYAARLEAEQPGRSQIARLELTGTGSSIEAVLRTQRELGTSQLDIERAPDAAGVPGAFVVHDSFAPNGDASLADAVNRTAYARTWNVPPAERGQTFWYRASYTEGSVRHEGQARRFTSPTGPSAATLEVTIVHNAYDSDIVGEIQAGSGAQELRSGGERTLSGPTFPLPGSGSAVSSDWVTGESTTGNVAWTFRIAVPSGAAEAYLPPDLDHPWFLRVDEGGFINRSGRVTSFRLVRHTEFGDETHEGGPVPRPTVEGQTAVLGIPQGALSVEPIADARGLVWGPNPVRAGGQVSFAVPSAQRGDLRVYDVAGREVARVPWRNGPEGARARWTAVDAAGRPLQGGVYFARTGRRDARRLVVLGP
jgi:hypothetical protein